MNSYVSLVRAALLALCLAMVHLVPASAEPAPPAGVTVVEGRWSVERINAWHKDQPWLVGANYVPRTAINQLEMWQADTFDPKTIDQEFAWAASIGMNTMRVFLHDLAWKQDPEGFLRRVDQFLAISDRHGIRPMLVLFDDVWHPVPKIGRQPEPTPHVHNSGWVQSPGKAILGNPRRHDELKPYVVAVLTRFKDDRRVLAWDLYNEPGNISPDAYGPRGQKIELADKTKYSMMLLEKVFVWARAVNPSQPLSASAWLWPGDQYSPFVDAQTLNPRGFDVQHSLNQFMLFNSDYINWHSYESVGEFAGEIVAFRELGRPLFLTEYLARENADGTNRFEYFLPLAKANDVAMYNWGLVDGKSQTKYPWDTWTRTWTKPPKVWHHDVFHANGDPYDRGEADLIRRLTRRPALAR